MKFDKILLLGYAPETLGKKEWDRINKLASEKILLASDSPDVAKHLSSADCLLVKLGAAVDKVMIDKMPRLEYIGMLGTGYGRIDTAYAKSKGVTVTNIAGYSTEGVAELAFGLIIEYLRELSRAKQQAKNSDYSEATFAGTEIKGKNFGVIGLGRIGKRIAEIANNGFQAKTSYWSKHRKKDAENKGIKYKDLGTLLQESDFLSLNLAFTPETEHFLNKQRINLIKPRAIVINLAPMELVDIAALTARLKKNDITFILDHSDELSGEQAKTLSQYKNCIMYPPIGYITKEATAAKLSMFVNNLENFLNGKPTNKVG